MVGSHYNIWLRPPTAKACMIVVRAKSDPLFSGKVPSVDLSLCGAPPIKRNQVLDLSRLVFLVITPRLLVRYFPSRLASRFVSRHDSRILVVPFHSDPDSLRVCRTPFLVFCYPLVSILLIVSLATSPFFFRWFGIGFSPALSGIAFLFAVSDMVLPEIITLFFGIRVRHTVKIS
jgi:hypothetical protein